MRFLVSAIHWPVFHGRRLAERTLLLQTIDRSYPIAIISSLIHQSDILYNQFPRLQLDTLFPGSFLQERSSSRQIIISSSYFVTLSIFSFKSLFAARIPKFIEHSFPILIRSILSFSCLISKRLHPLAYVRELDLSIKERERERFDRGIFPRRSWLEGGGSGGQVHG